MGKRGPKNPIEKKDIGDQVIAMHLDGKSQQVIADKLGIKRHQVQTYLSRINVLSVENLNNPNTNGQVRLEINQENALSELANQLQDYSDEYEGALDPKEKFAWSQNRIRILQEMNRVTGLYGSKCASPTTDPQVLLDQLSDEEVERRARDILAKRK